MATINTALHYNLRSMGAIAPGYKADMVVVEDLQDLSIKMVIKDSQVVAHDQKIIAPLDGLHSNLPTHVGSVRLPDFTAADLGIPARSSTIRVIGMRQGDLFTDALQTEPTVQSGYAVADPQKDLAKIVVFDRHRGSHYSKAFASGFGITRGALATTIGHDAHNLCVLGMNDQDMFQAVKRVEALNGGIVSVIGGKIIAELALPIGGLMSNKDLAKIVEELEHIKKAIHKMGSSRDILMSLHFVQLAVIPELKLTDQGLVNVYRQEFVDLFL
jgi:adenine deaminase